MAMTGAMSAAISGLKAHMDALNVVGNNVANVNTQGYKPGRVTFKESVYTTLSAGSGGTDTVGATNPRQMGYGCSVGTIDLDMSSQNWEPTGVPTDCAIAGDGFFIVGPKNQQIDSMDAVKGLSFSRVGNFEFRDGYLVDGQGNVVYGYLMSCETDPTNGGGQAGVAVDGAKYSTDLVPIRLPMKSTATGTLGEAIFPGVNGDGYNVYPTQDVDGYIDYESLTIDENGIISCVNSNTGDPVVVGVIALGKVDNPNGLMHTSGPYYQAGEAAGDVTLCAPGSSVTGYLRNSKIQDGNGVDPDTMLAAKTETSLLTSFLEQSGTDLATEFSNMIVYQRGYQANTRIVTVTDSMLEELVNMKR